ncbi:PseG/SpsG family protein [Sporosarcina sp. OR05]|uniref:PseG/SpsG family protein n=1 Tax=Sporosarcina sp. OR05 TaxID=2969819 RepID=UPI00352B4C23
MIPIENSKKKVVAFHITWTDGKGSYPARRAAVLAESISQQADVLFIVGENSPAPPEECKAIQIGKNTNLLQTLHLLKPDLLIRDSGSTVAEEVEKIREIVPSILHFDDFGDGGLQADFVLQTLLEDANDGYADHYIVDRQLFIADPALRTYEKSGLTKPKPGPLPHLVISFGEEDEGNLSYRALRHVSQLHIPLKVTLVIGERYAHDISTLKMMALGRRNTFVQQAPYHLPDIFSTADIILCGSGYTPYEIAVMGIPCIVLSQNDFELGLAFPKEHHGFSHLGLGRKVKQSNLLNAIMEPLLHESLRKRSIDRQLALNLGNGKDKVLETILYLLEYPKRGASGKALTDMLH